MLIMTDKNNVRYTDIDLIDANAGLYNVESNVNIAHDDVTTTIENINIKNLYKFMADSYLLIILLMKWIILILKTQSLYNIVKAPKLILLIPL